MKEVPLAKTTKEGRYLIRICGVLVLAVVLIGFAIRDSWFLPAGKEATPRYIYLALLVILALVLIANWQFWDSYLWVYKDQIIFKAYDQEAQLTIPYDHIVEINGVSGTYIDLPTIDLDTSNALTITTSQNHTSTYHISCSRTSFHKVLPLLLESWQAYHHA